MCGTNTILGYDRGEAVPVAATTPTNGDRCARKLDLSLLCPILNVGPVVVGQHDIRERWQWVFSTFSDLGLWPRDRRPITRQAMRRTQIGSKVTTREVIKIEATWGLTRCASTCEERAEQVLTP